ncbi:MAG: LCP family protein [Chloroflexota bacterium]|nr:LCP family protein [Chloroflexota bacterium]
MTQSPPPEVAYTLVPRTTRRKGSCLSPFVLAVLIIFFSCGCVVLAGVWLVQAAGGRTNVLILGLDRRPEQGYAVRSDTMMLLTAHPKAPHLALLSIPRDLYVEIPGYGQSRINTAHVWGEQGNPGRGPDLAMQTVVHNFGVSVRHYVRVDFEGFRAVVDAVGGIDVTVEEPILDNAYPTADYGTMRIEIPAGPQHMDGERALQYVRSRHGASDFERAARQQQVMIALSRELLTPRNWLRLPAVSRAVLENVETNLGPVEMVQVSVTVLRVGADGMEHRLIDRELTQPWTTPTGGAVLLPRWEAINPLVEELFRE